VYEKTLPNGVKLIVKETQGKGLVAGVAFFRGGLHGERKKGETLLLFKLLLKGTESYPDSYAVSYPFEKYGGSVYADSSDDYSELGFATRVEGLKEALSVVKELLLKPLLREEDLEREKKNQIAAIRAKRERGFSLAYEELRKLTYAGTPYETSPLGTEESVSSITRDDLVRRKEELIRGGNAVVVLVGDLKAEEAFKLLEETFKELPPGSYPVKPFKKKIEKDALKRVKREGTQSTILCAFNAPEVNTDEYFVFKVYDSLLGEGMTSRLFRRLREEKGYAYATYSFYPTRLFSPRLFAYVGTSPHKTDEALKDLVDTVRDHRVTDEEVEIAKRKEIGSFLLAHQTRLRQAWYLGFFEVTGLGWETDLKYPEKIGAVTARQVSRAVKRFIGPYHCVVVEP